MRVVDEEIGIATGELVETRGVYSSAETIAVPTIPYRMNVDVTRDVKPLSLTFVTALSASDDVSAGTSGPVRMTLGYYDRYGDLIQRTYEDVRPYIADGAVGFLAGSTVQLEMLVPDVADLRWVELEPYSEAESAAGQSAMWALESLNVTLDEGAFTKHCDTKTQIIEGTPLRLNMADILVAADVHVSGDEEVQTVTGGSLDLLIPSGDSIRIVPRIIGSYEGFTATLVKVDTTTGAFGRASLDDTRGYTVESIAAKAAAASDSREAAIWNNTKPQTGTFEVGANDISFTPPRNYTDKSVQYQIRVVSAENASSVLTINVTVENESDPVAQQLDELAKIMEREALQNALQQASSAGDRISNDIRTGAGE